MNNYITMDKWGKDHWSLLLYVETRIVDHNGMVDKMHMRNSLRPNATPYPTTLKAGNAASQGGAKWHDDFDCLDDLEFEGLIINTGTGIVPVLKLTDYGWMCISALRKYKAETKNIRNFIPPLPINDNETDVPVTKPVYKVGQRVVYKDSANTRGLITEIEGAITVKDKGRGFTGYTSEYRYYVLTAQGNNCTFWEHELALEETFENPTPRNPEDMIAVSRKTIDQAQLWMHQYLKKTDRAEFEEKEYDDFLKALDELHASYKKGK